MTNDFLAFGTRQKKVKEGNEEFNAALFASFFRDLGRYNAIGVRDIRFAPVFEEGLMAVEHHRRKKGGKLLHCLSLRRSVAYVYCVCTTRLSDCWSAVPCFDRTYRCWHVCGSIWLAV